MRQIQHGFTLVELMVAVAIFSFLSLASYQMLQGVLNTDKQAEVHAKRLAEVNRAFVLIGRDINQLVDRRIRQNGEQHQSSFNAGLFENDSESYGLEILRSGWSNPQAMLPRSQLQKVEYIQQQDSLLRRHYYYADTSVGDEGRAQVILSEIESFELRFMDDGQWLEKFDSEQSKLPKALEVNIQLKDLGKLRRVFMANDITTQVESL
ncbi:type II secretion system protein GspJ [Alginatibacterium sediminis]|uniref:Type II secretion system protein J n=1 Tax=Alginatibacterium sediminis TaxID=2164068 RepID=A0A420E5X6_9ALTE|nr:type II secretion system minor pseudopilin GspJ [Alginatibacterium sediminis]RKF13193.1 type II secretion system protein GspJ [Alginatibacterium sediminis]